MLASTKPGESAGTTGKAAPCPFSGKELNGFYGKNIVLLPCSSTHGPASLLSPETNHDGTCYPCLYCNAGGGTNTDAHVSTSRAGYPSANENGRRHVNSHYPDADASAGNHESNAPPAPTSHPGITHETGPASESDARFVQVSAGLFHTCGLRGDGTITCWGAHGEDERRTETIGLLESPPGSFTQIDAGSHHSCAVRKDGTMECWGGSSFDDVPQTPEEKAMKEALLEPPEGQFMSVSVGLWLDCGIKVDNSAECWGIGPVISDELNPPEGKYTSVSVGDDHACGIRIDQTVVCWGSNQGFDGDFLGQATPPDGPFEVINAGGYHTCGFRPDGEIRCWGSIVGGMDGEVTTCQQQPDGTSRCWTDDKATEANRAWGGSPDGTPDGNLKAMDSGQGFSCALWDGGYIGCWGFGGINDSPPPGIFEAVTVGEEHGCGLRPDGSIECWGDDRFGRASPPVN